MVHYFLCSGKWGHDPSHRSTIGKSRRRLARPRTHSLLLLHCPLPCSSSSCGAPQGPYWGGGWGWCWHSSPIAQQKAGFTLTLLSVLSHFTQKIWLCKLRSVQLEAGEGTNSSSSLCPRRVTKKPSLSPPAQKAISEHRIYASAATQHQAPALQRMFTATWGAWHTDLPSISSREGPELKCHRQKA